MLSSQRGGISTVPYPTSSEYRCLAHRGGCHDWLFHGEDVGGTVPFILAGHRRPMGRHGGGAVANELSVAVLAMQNAYTDAASRVNG
jgi:hypothetical protein